MTSPSTGPISTKLHRNFFLVILFQILEFWLLWQMPKISSLLNQFLKQPSTTMFQAKLVKGLSRITDVSHRD